MTVTNKDRAEWAAAAFTHYQQVEQHPDAVDWLESLLCDLMHYCDIDKFDFVATFENACARYAREKPEEKPTSSTATPYMAYFRTTAGSANDIYQAGSPDQALRIAQEIFDRDDESLGFTPGDCPELQQIRIATEDAVEVLIWQTDEYRLQLAAPKLLQALEKQIEITREIIDAWNNTDHLYSAVEDLISELDSKSQWAQEVLRASARCDLTDPIEHLEKSLDENLATIAQAKGGAA
jgi:hypothetical protein